jgi:hypothetical protein
MPFGLGVKNLSPDIANKQTHFYVTGTKDGKAVIASGLVPASIDPSMTGEAIEDAAREAVRTTLREIADSL